MRPNIRNGREAKTRRQTAARDRQSDHKAQAWTCGHKHGEFIYASRCGLNNSPVASPEERLLQQIFTRPSQDAAGDAGRET